MRIQRIDLVAASQERTLRQDFDYHRYNNSRTENYYLFNELFELLPVVAPADNELYSDFQYCEIGNADKDGNISPVMLNFENRNLEEDNYYKKIEKGDITHVSCNDILLAKVRPNLKKYVRITADIENVFFTKAFIRIKAKQMPEIMYYCFRSVFYDDLMAISRQGKGYPTLNEKDVATLRFDKNYIDKLFNNRDYVLKNILLREAQISALQKEEIPEISIIDDVFAREFGFDYSTFKMLKKMHNYPVCNVAFSNNPDLRFSAKFHRKAGEFVMSQLTALTDKKIKHFLAEPIVLGASVSPSDFDENGEAYYVSMATIKTLEIELDDTQLLSSEYFAAHTKKTLMPGDIVIARSGVAIGKTALVKNEFAGVFADFTMRVRLSNYSPEFAYYYFRTSYFQYLIEIYKKGLQNQNIFPIVIQEFPILDISLEEQQRIVDEIQTAIETQNSIKLKIAELRIQIDTIIEDIITGN